MRWSSSTTCSMGKSCGSPMVQSRRSGRFGLPQGNRIELPICREGHPNTLVSDRFAADSAEPPAFPTFPPRSDAHSACPSLSLRGQVSPNPRDIQTQATSRRIGTAGRFFFQDPANSPFKFFTDCPLPDSLSVRNCYASLDGASTAPEVEESR